MTTPSSHQRSERHDLRHTVSSRFVVVTVWDMLRKEYLASNYAPFTLHTRNPLLNAYTGLTRTRGARSSDFSLDIAIFLLLPLILAKMNKVNTFFLVPKSSL